MLSLDSHVRLRHRRIWLSAASDLCRGTDFATETGEVQCAIDTAMSGCYTCFITVKWENRDHRCQP
jgi:hypothetical protein